MLWSNIGYILVALRISKVIALWLNSYNPCLTFDPSNALHSGQGFFLPNLVAGGHFWVFWPLVDID